MALSIGRRMGFGLALALAATSAQAQQSPSPGLQVPRIQIPGASPPSPPAQQPAPSPGIQIPRVQVPAPAPATPAGPGTFEVRDVTFGAADGLTVRVGRMTFSGLVRSSDSVSAERAVFEGLTARAGGHKVEIPSVKITGLSLPADAFRALTEGGGGLDWSRLAQTAAAAEVAIDSITDEATAPGATTTYTEFLLTSLQAGKIASIRMSGSRGHIGAPDTPDHARFSSDEIRYQGIDLAEIVRFFTGGGSGGPKRLVEQAVVNGWSMTAADIAIRVAKFELGALDGRAPAVSLTQTVVPAKTPAGGPPRIVLPGKADEGEAGRRAAVYAQEVLRHLRIGRIAMEGLSFASPDFGIFEIGRIGLDDLHGQSLGRFEIAGLDVSASGASIKLERFAVEKFAFGSLLDFALTETANGREPDIDPETLGRLAPRVGAVRFAGLKAETPAGMFALAQARFEVDNPDVVLPEKVTFALDGMQLDVTRANDNPGREQLMALGYGQLAASFHMLVRWAPNEKALAFEDTRFTVDQVGRVDLTAKFANVNLDPANSSPQAAEEAMGRAHVEHLGARVTDLGLADRLFGQMSRGMGISPDAVRAGIAAEMRAQAEGMLGAALAPGSGEALEAFIRAPKRIAARAAFRPGRPPVTLAEMESLPPPELLERLTIAIEIPKD